MCPNSSDSGAVGSSGATSRSWDTGGYLQISSEFEILTSLDGMEGILLISRNGHVFWSWQNPEISLSIRTMRLVEMVRHIIPIMLSMPDKGIQRSLFQFDYNSECISLYFTNIGDHAFICCILGQKFDYINVTEEVGKTAFILGKKLSRLDIDSIELKRYLKEISARTSQSISTSMNQFSRITKKRDRTNGVN